ncbi:MAG: hypothetical protein IPK92_05190 [Nitrospira sp.]|nr:hypothetical protein [Nitrospira sp.]
MLDGTSRNDYDVKSCMIRSGCDPAFHGAAKREVDLALSYRQFHSGQ